MTQLEFDFSTPNDVLISLKRDYADKVIHISSLLKAHAFTSHPKWDEWVNDLDFYFEQYEKARDILWDRGVF